LFKSLDDGFALIGNTLALQRFALSLTLGGFDYPDLVGLGLLDRGHAQPLSSVDFVHTLFDLGVRINVRDQGLNDAIAEIVHDLVKFAFDGGGDFIFHLEQLVKIDGRYPGPDGVENKTSNLSLGILQAVEGINGFVGQNIVLYADNDKNKDVVFSLGLYPHVQLLNAQVQTPGNAVN